MIDAEVLNQAGISYEANISRFMNDAELYEAILEAFSNESLFERAEAAYIARDNALLLKVIHEAKGSSGNAGLDELYATACALVNLLRSPSFSENELAESYERFAKAYITTKNAIKAALGK